jgi:hypothetical protein
MTTAQDGVKVVSLTHEGKKGVLEIEGGSTRSPCVEN